MVQGIGAASSADLVRSLQDLGQNFQDLQAMAMQFSEKLLKAGVQQAVQDASLGNAVDLTA
jgi:hypothetical protein